MAKKYTMFTLWFGWFPEDLGLRLLCVSMFLLCGHLSHGVSSVFQSLGIRSDSWREKAEYAAKAYAWIIFLGFLDRTNFSDSPKVWDWFFLRPTSFSLASY